MRKPILAANWKMNKLNADVAPFLKSFAENLPSDWSSKADIVIAAAPTLLQSLAEAIGSNGMTACAQNVNENASGAYTGETSLAMLSEIPIQASLVGHSERRQYYGESDQSVAAKTKLLLENNCLAIVCIGESKEQREGLSVSGSNYDNLLVIQVPAQGEPNLLWMSYGEVNN